MFLSIDENTTLADLTERVSSENISAVLAANGLAWRPNVGQIFAELCASAQSSGDSISWEQQYAILNKLTQNLDIFEYACSMGASGWQVMSALGTFPGMLMIPDNVQIASGSDTLGNGVPVPSSIYQSVMSDVMNAPHIIDLSVFNEYSNSGAAQSGAGYNGIESTIFEAFHIPWGDVTLWSSITDTTIDFPVYPETIDDSTSAEYNTMPDMLYQYEPWLVYKSSGPRSPKYTFKFHRDMWTGDHRDGKANELIRFCQSQCYPEFNGSAIVVPAVSLFVAGKRLITGVITNVSTTWEGPIGLDGWYLVCTLELSITEVSQEPLTHSTVRNKPLIG